MNFINRIVNTGVKEEFAFPQKRKIILLNYLCLIASFILVIYLPVNFVLDLPLFFYAVNITGQIIVWSCIWLNHQGKYGHARVFANVFLLLFINSFCLFTGEGTGAEYINLVLFVLPLVIFDNKKLIVLFSILAFVSFIICKIIFKKYEALYHHHNSDVLFYWIGTSVVFFSTFYLLSRFKKEIVSYTQLIEEQHKEITEKNEEINASLRYAKEIQKALFFNNREIKEILPNSFGLMLPYGFVSGDFYWVTKKGKHIYAAVADCTGHGIPAALMTIVGHNLLNEGLIHQGLKTPGDLLSFMNKNLLSRFKQKSNNEVALNDGMDIAICVFDFEEKKLEYAGANRPMYVVREKELIEISPTKCSLGGHTPIDQTFRNNAISLNEGDWIYLFTDGCTDQQGGEKGKKFSKKRLKELLVSFTEDLSADERIKIVKKTFQDWQGKFPKTDDSFITGIKI